MANNRIMLRCRECGDVFTLFKYYPGTGWYRSNIAPDMDAVEAWFEKHDTHAMHHDLGPLGGSHYDIGYENGGDKNSMTWPREEKDDEPTDD